MSGLRRNVLARVALVALVSAFGFALTACGGGGDDEEATPTASVESTADTVSEEPTAAAGETIDVGKSLWHSGMKVTVNEATFEPAPSGRGGSVLLDVVFENLGVDTASFQSMVVLIAGGANYEDGGREQDTPNVPAGLTANGVLAFDVAEAVDLEEAMLQVGNPMNNQATIALGSDDSDDVTLEPIEIAVTGDATAGAVTLTVERAELRADIPEKHDIVEKGSLALTIYFSATVASGIPIGEGVLQSQNVALRLPDGTAVAVPTDGISGVNELLQDKEGTTIRNLDVRFIIPSDEIDGEYAFIVRGRYSPEGQVEGELAFTIDTSGGAQAGSSTPVGSTTPASGDATREATPRVPAAAPAQ